jgi:sterol desaturase/sphingolipid hydroxylase (fatty acid hydroxylase superfamily)
MSFEAIFEPSLAIFDPSKRVFWGSILGSLLLIVLVSGGRRWQHLRILISPQIWLHPSSRADVKIVLINSLLRAGLAPSSCLGATGLAAIISLGLTRLFGAKPVWDWPAPVIMALYSLTIFLADDFARFLHHYLQHRWRALWFFHQVHHSALVLTPLTLYRTHPVDMICAHLRNTLTYGSVTGIFFFAFGPSLSAWDILGASALGFLFNLLGANLRHSQVWIDFGPLEHVLISPAAHQVHHSADAKHFDRNFGVCLTCWDLLFRTYYDPRQIRETLTYGLPGSPLSASATRLWDFYWLPIRDYLAYRRGSEGEASDRLKGSTGGFRGVFFR